MNTATLLSDAIIKTTQQQSYKDIQTPHALVVNFRHTDRIDEFKDMISPIVDDFKRHDDLLISFQPSKKRTQALANTIGTVLYNFDQSLLKQPFTPDWLTNYFAVNHYGVDHAMVGHHLSHSDEISAYLECHAKAQHSMRIYEQRMASAKAQVLDYTDEQMAHDLGDFLYANWSGFDSQAMAYNVIGGALAALRQTTTDWYFFSRHPAQHTLFALKYKADFLARDRDPDDGVAVRRIKNQYAVDKAFRRIVESSRTHNTWTMATALLDKFLKQHAPKLRLSGLPALLKNEAAPIPEQTRFMGLDLSYTEEVDLNKRLSPARLRYDMQEQDIDCVNSWPAGLRPTISLSWN